MATVNNSTETLLNEQEVARISGSSQLSVAAGFFVRGRINTSNEGSRMGTAHNPLQGSSPSSFTTKGALPASYRRLLETMQRLNFGKIENLEIRGGLPVFEPPPLIVKDVKIGGENSARPELEMEDFLLKAPVIEFFEHLNRLGNGKVAQIEIRYGQPFRLLIEQPAKMVLL